jgi:hypothetical protein
VKTSPSHRGCQCSAWLASWQSAESVNLLRKVSRIALTMVGSASLLAPTLWPIALAAFILGLAALAVIARAAFTKRSTPMERLRAFVRDLRGDG